ncbi:MULTISPECIES: iron ABC transporter permease [unclassified Neptuniibacter]|uniref:FecCD family ABC transporter permease n=1 Tax=unclassified Neptuniibacter TaxID=2630693 RepID=UPI0026E1955A|nr:MULTISPECIES: iron ABC transporter permease [unclassified Neptuniibacter]MDO6512604.1 iron ABC transporter permease [Neptuniibacter sp. 2_MG-2023]MDO6593561.1 iron ABC transporter permease [Neptuniibacter sp. 1_MG-2023]
MQRSVSVCALALASLLIACALLSLVLGAMNLPVYDSLLIVVDDLFGANFSQLEGYQQVVVLELRLPRLLLAIFVGAILAQCGAVAQGLFRNPLADPGIIGVSSGAAVGAILAIVVFPAVWGSWTIPTMAFVGGLLTTLLVYGLAQSKNGTSVLVLLLAGVAISAFAGAAIGFLSYFADDASLRELNVWQMGSLTGASDANLWLAFTTMLLLMIAFQRRAQALNALLLGEPEARHLGIDVEQLKLQMIILTAIGVGVAVSCSGIIGFVGLVVPHLVRLATGPNHHFLLPLSALLGAVLLMGSDLLARLVVQPAELPVGLVTVLLGAPFFLILLIQQRKNWS